MVFVRDGEHGIAGPIGEADRDVDLTGPHGSVIGVGMGKHHTYERARAIADRLSSP